MRPAAECEEPRACTKEIAAVAETKDAKTTAKRLNHFGQIKWPPWKAAEILLEVSRER